MNTFEVAVLRVLVKRHTPLRLYALVSGFPDSCEDGVLSAISSLQLGGFLRISEFSPDGYVSVLPSRKAEALSIANSERLLESEGSIGDNYSIGLQPWVAGGHKSDRASSGVERLSESKVPKKPKLLAQAMFASLRARRVSAAFVLAFGIMGLLMAGGGAQVMHSPAQRPVAVSSAQHEPPVIQTGAADNDGHVTIVRFEGDVPGSLLVTYTYHGVTVIETLSNSSATFATYVETPRQLPQE